MNRFIEDIDIVYDDLKLVVKFSKPKNNHYTLSKYHQ